MRTLGLVLALLLTAWSLVPAASAIEEPPTCIGPPCEPVDVEAPCVVDGWNRDCLVTIEMYVCVTGPCPGITVCVLRGAHCLTP